MRIDAALLRCPQQGCAGAPYEAHINLRQNTVAVKAVTDLASCSWPFTARALCGGHAWAASVSSRAWQEPWLQRESTQASTWALARPAMRSRVMGPMLCCSSSPAAGLLTLALAAACSCKHRRGVSNTGVAMQLLNAGQ